jgi:hypothetical protein
VVDISVVGSLEEGNLEEDIPVVDIRGVGSLEEDILAEGRHQEEAA